MTVYIVSQGEAHEGSRIMGVFDSLAKAEAYAANLRAEITKDVDWRDTTWDEFYPGCWENGCDIVLVKAHEVESTVKNTPRYPRNRSFLPPKDDA